jgi:predicted  nucleic acid-binding Zn-ribbon protein
MVSDQQVPDPSAESEPSSPFEALLVLQDEDLLADQLQYRLGHLAQHTELHTIEAEYAVLERRAAPIRAERAEAAQRQAELEDEIEEITERIGAIDRRLRTDTGGSFRDQAAMSTEIASLTDRRRQLEDSELEIMEILEPIDGQLGAIDAERSALELRARTLLGEIKMAEAEVKAEIATVLSHRAELASKVPDVLRSEYERLRTRLGGIGAARLTHGVCSGCNLSLSATELDHIRHASPEMAFHCDQCGRILVP